MNWQNIAVWAVIAITVAAFVWHMLRARGTPRKPGCGSGCDCGSKPARPPITPIKPPKV